MTDKEVKDEIVVAEDETPDPVDIKNLPTEFLERMQAQVKNELTLRSNPQPEPETIDGWRIKDMVLSNGKDLYTFTVCTGDEDTYEEHTWENVYWGENRLHLTWAVEQLRRAGRIK